MHQSTLPGSLRARRETSPASSQSYRKSVDMHKAKDLINAPRATRGAEASGPLLSRAEIASLPGQDIMDANKGLSYLDANLLSVPDVPCSLESMTAALFQISMLPGIKSSQTNTSAVRAVVFILTSLETEAKARVTANLVMSKMEEQLASLSKRVEEVVSDAWEGLKEASSSLKGQLKAAIEGQQRASGQQPRT